MNNNVNPENPNPNPNPNQNPYGDPQSFGGYTQYQQPYAGQYQQPYYPPSYVDESGLFGENKMLRRNGASAHVTVGDWLKSDCLSFLIFIPIIGTIAYIVIYCILAFSSKTNRSMKTRYQANLIWSAIVLGLYLLLLLFILLVLGVSFNELFDELTPY